MDISAARRRYALVLMFTLNVLNYVDRQLPSILLPSIRRDLHLNDSELAFITGLAFALFYTLMCLPLGRMADKYNRRIAITLCVGLWSLMTTLTGLAQSFVHIMIARFGVGVGEAGLNPNSQSIISDMFAQKGRATAIALFSAGIPVGTLIAFLAGGNLDHVFGWRVAFIALGIPGLILAAVVFLTLPDPVRGAADKFVDTGHPPPVWTVVKTLWSIGVYRWMMFGTGFTGLCYVCCTTWAPSFLSRSFGLNTAQIGTFMAPAVGLGGMLGTFAGGWLVDRLSPRDVRWAAWMPTITVGFCVLPTILIFSAGNATAAILLLTIPLVLCPTHLAAFSATSQSVAPLRMRGMAPAFSLLVTAGVIGLGVGPQIIGALSDLLRPSRGEESLRYALMIVAPASALIAASCFFMGSRSIAGDLAAAAARQRGSAQAA